METFSTYRSNHQYHAEFDSNDDDEPSTIPDHDPYDDDQFDPESECPDADHDPLGHYEWMVNHGYIKYTEKRINQDDHTKDDAGTSAPQEDTFEKPIEPETNRVHQGMATRLASPITYEESKPITSSINENEETLQPQETHRPNPTMPRTEPAHTKRPGDGTTPADIEAATTLYTNATAPASRLASRPSLTDLVPRPYEPLEIVAPAPLSLITRAQARRVREEHLESPGKTVTKETFEGEGIKQKIQPEINPMDETT
jgi:hypothetical protein